MNFAQDWYAGPKEKHTWSVNVGCLVHVRGWIVDCCVYMTGETGAEEAGGTTGHATQTRPTS